MFEHLDDPEPPALGSAFRRAAVERGRQRRRHRRMAGAAGLTVASLLVGVGGLYGRVAWRAGQIERVEVAGTASVAAGEPVTVLVLGGDSRNLGTDQVSTDTILLARIDPGAGTGALLSLPRDLMVDAPDGSGPVVINSVAARNGIDGLVAVIETEVGIPVDHVVQVGFDGIVSLVDEVGGIDVWVDAPVRDTHSGLFVEELGCVNLDGEQTLALLRSRYLEVLDPATGAWVRDPLSDLSRVGRQRRMVIAALSLLGDEGIDPVALDRRVDWALDHMVIDAELGRDDLVRLARAVADLDPGTVASATYPVIVDPADPNRLAADPAAAPAAVEAFVRGGPWPPVSDLVAGEADEGPAHAFDVLSGRALAEPC